MFLIRDEIGDSWDPPPIGHMYRAQHTLIGVRGRHDDKKQLKRTQANLERATYSQKLLVAVTRPATTMRISHNPKSTYTNGTFFDHLIVVL